MTAAIVPQDFYVYTHHKATTGEIFYVGKGQGRRAWDAAKNKRTAWWHYVARKHGVRVEIVQDGLQEWAAFELEQKLIALHGRQDQNDGPLVNLSDGGEGGASGVKRLEHTRKAMSKAAQTRWSNTKAGREAQSKTAKLRWEKPNARAQQAERSKQNWQKTSDKVKKEVSEISKARWNVESYRHKVTENIKAFYKTEQGKQTLAERAGKCKKAVVCNGVIRFESLKAASEWLQIKRNGSLKVKVSALSACLAGKHKTAYGYQWAFAPEA